MVKQSINEEVYHKTRKIRQLWDSNIDAKHYFRFRKIIHALNVTKFISHTATWAGPIWTDRNG